MVMTVEERKESVRVRGAKYKAENKEKIDLANKKYRENNKEKIAANGSKWASANRNKINAANKRYRKNNKEKVNFLTSNGRARRFGATIYMTKEDKAKIAELYTIAQDATKLFGYGWAVDHIVPLNKGGLHKLSNLQVVPMTWNRSKCDRNCDTYWD